MFHDPRRGDVIMERKGFYIDSPISKISYDRVCFKFGRELSEHTPVLEQHPVLGILAQDLSGYLNTARRTHRLATDNATSHGMSIRMCFTFNGKTGILTCGRK
jgi:hypothetical protein